MHGYTFVRAFDDVHSGTELDSLDLNAAIGTVAASLAAGEERLEAVAARSLPLLDALFGVASALAALGACVLVWLVAGSAWSVYALESGRNALGYVGLTLLARPVVGPRAAALPAIAASMVAALLGSHADGTARWWAWPIADARDERSWLLAFAMLMLGTLVFIFSRPRLPE
ncbi:MAG: hypothetical protein U0031_09495 [Thermomicrobiales bacterium]